LTISSKTQQNDGKENLAPSEKQEYLAKNISDLFPNKILVIRKNFLSQKKNGFWMKEMFFESKTKITGPIILSQE
jgi:hypothetical protein